MATAPGSSTTTPSPAADKASIDTAVDGTTVANFTGPRRPRGVRHRAHRRRRRRRSVPDERQQRLGRELRLPGAGRPRNDRTGRLSAAGTSWPINTHGAGGTASYPSVHRLTFPGYEQTTFFKTAEEPGYNDTTAATTAPRQSLVVAVDGRDHPVQDRGDRHPEAQSRVAADRLRPRRRNRPRRPNRPDRRDGRHGRDRPAGPTGPAGAASTVPGPTGPTGATGPAGSRPARPGAAPTGRPARRAPTGAPGATGPAGATGPTGPQGAPGTRPRRWRVIRDRLRRRAPTTGRKRSSSTRPPTRPTSGGSATTPARPPHTSGSSSAVLTEHCFRGGADHAVGCKCVGQGERAAFYLASGWRLDIHVQRMGQQYSGCPERPVTFSYRCGVTVPAAQERRSGLTTPGQAGRSTSSRQTGVVATGLPVSDPVGLATFNPNVAQTWSFLSLSVLPGRVS